MKERRGRKPLNMSSKNPIVNCVTMEVPLEVLLIFHTLFLINCISVTFKVRFINIIRSWARIRVLNGLQNCDVWEIRALVSFLVTSNWSGVFVRWLGANISVTSVHIFSSKQLDVKKRKKKEKIMYKGRKFHVQLHNSTLSAVRWTLQ